MCNNHSAPSADQEAQSAREVKLWQKRQVAPPRTGKKNPLREQINNEGFSQWTVCFHHGGHASWGCSVCETLHFAPTGKPQAVAPGCITSDTSDWDREFSQLHSKHFLEAHGPWWIHTRNGENFGKVPASKVTERWAHRRHMGHIWASLTRMKSWLVSVETPVFITTQLFLAKMSSSEKMSHTHKKTKTKSRCVQKLHWKLQNCFDTFVIGTKCYIRFLISFHNQLQTNIFPPRRSNYKPWSRQTKWKE